MTNTLVPRVHPQSLSIAPALFAVAIFTSASLVFMVQPMVTKLILPSLGGSPAVWNTAMVFFQFALLLGYLYAHLLQRVKTLKAQTAIHFVLLLLAGLFLPLQISGLLGEPNTATPIIWLLLTLLVSVGAPFAVLSATAPLLQAWYARVRVEHEDGQNPYVLYAASNLGSLIALLAYPLLVEPLLTLSNQRVYWTAGYGVFAAMVLMLALHVWSNQSRDPSKAVPTLEVSAPIPWVEKLIWVAMAAIPSSLMLGVTAYISTDVASAPFLWVVPLALYLLTFVIAFSRRPVIPLRLTLVFQAAAVIAIASLVAMAAANWAYSLVLHLVAFFFTALMCHQRLAARRPPPDRLTEFYLLMSLGGVIGGAFTALLAPQIFTLVLEYPLVLLLSCFVRPWDYTKITRKEMILFVVGVLFAIAAPIVFEIMRYNPSVMALLATDQRIGFVRILLGIAAICAFLVRDRGIFLAIIMLAVMWTAQHVSRGYETIEAERSFFGVMRLQTTQEPRMGGTVHVLLHGTTVHGAQAQNGAFKCSPTMYYATSGPLGRAMLAVQQDNPAARIGVVGQGAGGMAAYKRSTDTMTFFEIDPMMDRVSRDPTKFSYISDCAAGEIDTVLGDARLTLSKQPEGSFDYLLIDAFSSDAVPTHLLTREAIEGYIRLLKPEGVVVLHLSNRNLEITHPVYAAAKDLGLSGLHQLYYPDPGQPYLAVAGTEAVVLARTPEALATLKEGGGWGQLKKTEVRAWTDDYVNLVGALDRYWRAYR